MVILLEPLLQVGHWPQVGTNSDLPFQDGHYIYQVLPGYGVGSQAEAPTLFIADLENPSQLHIIVKP